MGSVTRVCVWYFDIPDESLREIAYTPRAPGNPTLPLNEESMKKILFTKYEGWKYEKEIRLWVDLNLMQQEKDLYFCPFHKNLVLREVYSWREMFAGIGTGQCVRPLTTRAMSKFARVNYRARSFV